MHIHILGICGTFMAGIAEIAVQLGHRVSGCDASVYPPMSTFLRSRGIDIHEGYDPAQFSVRPDLVIIGNALSRGNAAVEHVLNARLHYCSGAQWLAENVLHDRHVIAVAGTHGKTTTTSILAYILREAGLEPGYLIGGIAHDFEQPATLGNSDYFVIEADEYDTAFFDKRSKFVHYRPTTLIINNLEFDHADIFPDLDAIKTQFHHLLRTVPANGLVLHAAAENAIDEVLKRGCWSRRLSFGVAAGADCRLEVAASAGANEFTLHRGHGDPVVVRSKLLGRHNMQNTAAAVLAAVEVGVDVETAAASAGEFGGVKRRLECIGVPRGVTVYDDFAHHPTAIATTLEALRNSVGTARVLCVLEPRSNTMRLGIHAATLAQALNAADEVYLYGDPALNWDPVQALAPLGAKAHVHEKIDTLVAALTAVAMSGDHIVIMSNGAFAGIHELLLNALDKGLA